MSRAITPRRAAPGASAGTPGDVDRQALPPDAAAPVDDGLRIAEEGLRSLAVPAPAAVIERTLVQVGLADAVETFDAPIGPVLVAWNGRGVAMVDLADDQGFTTRHAEATGRPLIEDVAMPDRLRQAVARRLAGDRRARVAIDLRGRAGFERAVWEKALEIPRGEVRPYGWIAAEIGRPRAVRAVGSALGRNPVPLIIPCHRVVRTDGTIGQYSLGGPEVKRHVLATEGVDLGALEAYAAAGIRYLGSDTTRIYCHPTCHNARRITPTHRRPFGSAAQAAAAGYRACRECRPAAVAA
jgi:O-6-methylguanine DNA methyltransferase